MEAIVIPLLLSTADKLFAELKIIITLNKQNATVVRDIEEFRQSLEADLHLVETRRKTLQDDQAWAIDSLSKDLEDANMYLENCRKQGWFQGHWDAKRTRNELTALRQKLSHNFQVKLFFTSLEVIRKLMQSIPSIQWALKVYPMTIDKEKRTEGFHAKLVELTTLSATRSINEIKGLLKPLATGLKVQEARVHQLRAEIRALSAPFERDDDSYLDTEKFLQDILAGLADSVPSNFCNASEDDFQYYDPFTCELMFDPVKCDDGKTYDRFSVFKYNMESRNKPLVILCPDESVRARLFDKFRHEKPDKIMKSRRNEYRTEALAMADAGAFGEGIVRLDNVLQWDPNDSECLQKRGKMRDFYRLEALNLAGNRNREEAVDMLETVQKWLPLDQEIFDKLKMMKQENSTIGDCELQQQSLTHNETVSSKVRSALEAPVPMSPMYKQDKRGGGTSNGEKEGSVLKTDGNNSRSNFPSKTARSEATPEHVHNYQPKTSSTLQTGGSNIPGDQHRWYNDLCCVYLACLLCQCQPCGVPELFARDVTWCDSRLICLYFTCTLPLSAFCCLDSALSTLSCYYFHHDDCMLNSWLRRRYKKQFQMQ